MSPVLVNPSRFTSATPASFATTAAALSPSAWYRLNEATGATTFADSSGNSHNGTVSSGVTFQQTGLVTGDSNHSALFNGSSVDSQVAYGSWMDAPTAFSLFALSKTTTTSGTQMMLSRDLILGAIRLWQMRLNAGVFEFVKIPGSVVVASAPSGTADGNIHDYGVTYDGSNIRLYVDGVKVTTTAAAGSFGTASAPLYLGLLVSGTGGPSSCWNGTLDELMYKAGTVWADSVFAALHAAR